MAKLTAISEEEFIAWRDDPVTQWVMAACVKGAEIQKAGWIAASWEGGDANIDLLIECRTRADAYRALVETDFIGWQRAHGEEE